MSVKTKHEVRDGRHQRVRSRLSGKTDRPRLTVYKSLNNIYAQIIDDHKGCTLVAASSVEKGFKTQHSAGGNKEAAKVVGEQLAAKAKAKGIEAVVFDRGGFRYHGRVKELAEAARKGGLQF